MGVLGDGERKSVEPIAARACGDPAKVDAAHQSLLHFVANARWSDAAVRRPLCQEEMSREPGACRGTIRTQGCGESKLIRWLEHTPSVFEMR
jgi:hypothetical protein